MGNAEPVLHLWSVGNAYPLNIAYPEDRGCRSPDLLIAVVVQRDVFKEENLVG
jgi:hypothetical protein